MALSSDSLCSRCKSYNLSRLFAPTQGDLDLAASKLVRQLENERAVVLDKFRYADAVKSQSCDLCKLVVECGRRAGLDSSYVSLSIYFPEEPVMLMGHGKRCCSLRPEFEWSSQSSKHAQQKSTSTLQNTGRIHVWFYRERPANKIASTDPDALSPLKHPRLKRIRKWINSRRQEPSHKEDDRPDLAPSDEESTTAPAPDADDTQADMRPTPDNLYSLDRDEMLMPRRASGRGADRVLNEALGSWTVDIVGSTKAGRSLPNQLNTKRQAIREQVDSALVQAWLSDCASHHGHHDIDSVAWSRLRRVLSSGFLRAIDTSTGSVSPLSEGAEYVALSYVWGTAVLPHLPRISNTYPRSIRNAMEFARQLGFKHLWVDRICINQNDEAEKDMLIPCMRDIFSLAQLTIVAAAGDGTHTGLPGVGGTARGSEQMYQVGDLQVLPSQSSFNALFNASIWKTRGWTFEEHVFSRHLLYIFPSEIIFSCAEGTYRESTGEFCKPGSAGSTWGDLGVVPPSNATILHAKVHGKDRGFVLSAREYVQSVEEYTARELTFEEDRVKAFAGLLTIATANLDPLEDLPVLLHGHPTRFFEVALTWSPDEDSVRRKPFYGKPFAPSWSWASAGVKVRFLDNGEDHSITHWFNYSIWKGLDMLGTPQMPVADEIISMFLDPRLASAEFQRIMTEQPWETTTGETVLPSYETMTANLGTHRMPTKLPVMHLLTVVFDALLKPTDGHGVWSMGRSITVVESLPPDPTKKAPDEHTGTFALVAGGTRIYLMWIEKQSVGDFFYRRGLLRLSYYSYNALTSLARRGNVRWEYIQVM